MIEEEQVKIRNQAIHWAWETHFQRFNIETKPKAEEVIKAARKFEEYLLNG